MRARRRTAWLTGTTALAVVLLMPPPAPAGGATGTDRVSAGTQRISTLVPSIPPARPAPTAVGRVVRSQILMPGVVLQVIRATNPPQQISIVLVAPWARVRASLAAAGPAWAPFATVSSAVRRRHALVGVNGYFRGRPSESPMLVRDGRIVALNRGALPTERHPRTAVGIEADGGLVLVTVDGRRDDAIGMTYRELAGLMRSLGARWAVNLDGGASTTMVAAGRVVNRPSDPFGQRVVPTVVVLTVTRGALSVPLLRQLITLDPRIALSGSSGSPSHGRSV